VKAYYLMSAVKVIDASIGDYYRPHGAQIIDQAGGRWKLCYTRGTPTPTHFVVAVSDRLTRNHERDPLLHETLAAIYIKLGDTFAEADANKEGRAETRGATLIDQTVGDE
jgi:hypothetical protein